MKVAVISDIHGNLVALETVAHDIELWQPDVVIVDGDTVNRGPRSLDCLNFVLNKQTAEDWRLVKGNHEDYIIDCDRPDAPLEGPEFEIRRFAQWTYDQLNGNVKRLQEMPDGASVFAPDGSELRAVHASMRNNRDGVYPDTTDDELREIIAPPPAVFVTGHTHRPLIRQIDGTQVVNVGSVGSSFDGDRRSGYGRFQWTKLGGWQCDLRRVAYDWEQMEQDYISSGFIAEAGPLAQLMLIELRRAGGLVYRWASRYIEAVKAGHLTMEESVRLVLCDEDLRPFLGSPGWEFD